MVPFNVVESSAGHYHRGSEGDLTIKYTDSSLELMTELLQVADVLGIRVPKFTVVSAHKIPMILRLPNFIFSRVANKMLEVDPSAR
jgi:hypothetical protein